jgi:Arc/MetJ-type ribon-helix-helix transcriptional regulator
MVYIKERIKMNEKEEWKDTYKKTIQDWKEQYNKAIEDWKEKLRDVKQHTNSNVPEGAIHVDVPMPMPMPMPSHFQFHTGRSNVVASRIGDEELQSIDLLVEGGLFETRSEAVAYLVREGVKARKDILSKVTSALEDIRKLRKEAEEQVANLRKNIGMTEPLEPEKPEDQSRMCLKCGKDLSELPEGIVVCPYCGTKIKKD